MDDFYAARSRTIPPLPWSSFPPPFSAGAAFGSVRCQAAILLASILSLGLAGSLFWAQLARYEAALAACAGV